MKFWDTHAKEMRRARLLNVTAMIFTQTRFNTTESAELSLQLEKELDKQLLKEVQSKKS